MTQDVVVATDGSHHGATAVRWAAHYAAHLDAPLRIVSVREPWVEIHEVPLDVDTLRDEIADDALSTALAVVQEAAPGLEVTTSKRTGHVAEELAEEVAGAGLLVVGARGRGGFTGLLLGSTSLRLTSHVSIPVAVIRSVPAVRQGVVVVGTDGTDLSLGAIEFAFAHAAASGASVRVVYTIQHPYVLDVDGSHGLWSQDVVTEGNQKVLAQVAPVRARFPDLSVDVRIAQGHPGSALVQQSESADLIVVGSRGRSPARSWLLGSVSHSVLQHASCPVVVVPRPRD